MKGLTSTCSSQVVDLSIAEQQELGYMPLRDEFERVSKIKRYVGFGFVF